MDELIRVDHVSKRFAGPAGEIEALRGANLHIAAGEFVCLIGASGCGKSTLLRIVAGFEDASEGQVIVSGRPVAGPGPDRGMVFQDYGLFPWMSVRGNIGFGPAARGLARKEVAEIAERYHRHCRPARLRRRLSPPALGRHEAARRHRPGAGQ